MKRQSSGFPYGWRRGRSPSKSGKRKKRTCGEATKSDSLRAWSATERRLSEAEYSADRMPLYAREKDRKSKTIPGASKEQSVKDIGSRRRADALLVMTCSTNECEHNGLYSNSALNATNSSPCHCEGSKNPHIVIPNNFVKKKEQDAANKCCLS